MADKVQTLISLYLLNKMLWCIEIIFLVEFFNYLEKFWYNMVMHKLYDINSLAYFSLNHRA